MANSKSIETQAEQFESLLWCWTKHLLALYFPITATIFLLTAPHTWLTLPLFALPAFIAYLLDISGKEELRAPNPNFPDWPFNLIMLVAVGIQFLNIYLLVSVFAQFLTLPFTFESVLSIAPESFFAIMLVGSSSGYSAIVLAHEFVHRRNPLFRLMGRALLVTAFYEHFHTEHLRGHHVRVATPNDPATAKFGDSFWPFYAKTVPAQFRSAWNIERKRLGDENMSLFDIRVIKNHVFQGMAAQLLLSACILYFFGAFSLFLFLVQAIVASHILEVVNYFEHWGLTRAGKRVQPEDSWDTHAWFTYYGLVGLTRHADHHANPTRPYQSLRIFEESPRMPVGYIAMVVLVTSNNRKFKKMMTKALQKQKLGPFREHQSDISTHQTNH